MSTILQPGQNRPLSAARVEIQVDGGPAENFRAQTWCGLLLLDAGHRAGREPAFISNGQPAGPGIAYDPESRMARIDLSAVPPDIASIELVAAIRGGLGRGATFSVLGQIRLCLRDGPDELVFPVPPLERGETALILGQCYRHRGQWKFRAVGQGFGAGLAALESHYGLSLPDPAPVERPPTPPEPSGERQASGTGFVIGAEGFVVTNQHVIADATAILGRSPRQRLTLVPIFADPINDLALLKTDSPLPHAASFRSGPPARLGEAVVAVGYPLGGILGSGPQVTTGNLSALIGMHDDTRVLQFTAPIQSGNSGGPLFDGWGQVIGMVTAKLDAARIHALTGDVPQNVNFAMKSALIVNFLDALGVACRQDPPAARRDPADIAAAAQDVVIRIECQL